jgi:hypothetical protein
MSEVVRSQTPTGEVTGIVTTPDNVPLRGVSISLLNADFLRNFDGRATRVRIQPRSTNRFLVQIIESDK